MKTPPPLRLSAEQIFGIVWEKLDWVVGFVQQLLDTNGAKTCPCDDPQLVLDEIHISFRHGHWLNVIWYCQMCRATVQVGASGHITKEGESV